MIDPYSADSAKRKERKFYRAPLDPNVRVVAIFSVDGLPIASVLPNGADETWVAAMGAAFFSLAKRAVIEMKKGDFEALYIKGSDGYLITLYLSEVKVVELIVIFSTTKDVELSYISSENLRRIAKEVALSIIEAQWRG
ncbi:MAG: roadblock/LC7 domain-containing protein [Promethearchaeota archaeon]